MLEGIGAEVIVSRPTGKGLLQNGVRHCVDDICVPVKLYYGHVLDLKSSVDYLFVSRMVSVEKNDSDTYTCPKLIGLPDMIKSSLDCLPPIIDFVVDVQNRPLAKSVKRLSEQLQQKPSNVKKRLGAALDVQHRFESALLRGMVPEKAMEAVLGNIEGCNGEGPGKAKVNRPARNRKPINIALVGHEYLIHEPYISHNLPRKLEKMGARVSYMSQLPQDLIEDELARYPGISWSYEKELLGAASYFLRRKDIHGVMLVMGFACGPDSIIGEIINREVRQKESPPLTTLVLDEHTGEAGVATRVEAFVDMIRRSCERP